MLSLNQMTAKATIIIMCNLMNFHITKGLYETFEIKNYNKTRQGNKLQCKVNGLPLQSFFVRGCLLYNAAQIYFRENGIINPSKKVITKYVLSNINTRFQDI